MHSAWRIIRFSIICYGHVMCDMLWSYSERDKYRYPQRRLWALVLKPVENWPHLSNDIHVENVKMYYMQWAQASKQAESTSKATRTGLQIFRPRSEWTMNIPIWWGRRLFQSNPTAPLDWGVCKRKWVSERRMKERKWMACVCVCVCSKGKA